MDTEVDALWTFSKVALLVANWYGIGIVANQGAISIFTSWWIYWLL
jgi:hypothetical protein